MIKGYMDKILRVDLSAGELKDIPYPEEWKKNYIGGSGVAARIIYDEVPPGIDAFDAKNVFCLFTGPWTGTLAPTSGRYEVASKSPLTGGWGEASCSGYFAPQLKAAGYDGIIVTGKSEKPVYLAIIEGKAELKPADAVWGKSTTETEQIIQEAHNEPKMKVASIGQAGEKLARYACVISDGGRAAGRCGIGAVMGSKRLKAIAVRGTQKVAVAASDFKEIAKDVKDRWKQDFAFQAHGDMGTNGSLQMAMNVGDVPIKNFQKSAWPEAIKLSGATPDGDYDKLVTKRYACYNCALACGRMMKLDKEIAGVKPFEGHAPEYETVGLLGASILNSDIETVAAANHVCNEAGLDTINTGSMVSFAYEAFEKGIITKKDVGFDLKWGDGEAMVRLVQMIVNREKIGDLLAEGPVIATKKLGKDSQAFAMHVKGMGLPSHDPRTYFSAGLEYAVSNRGACHLQGFTETWESYEHFYIPMMGDEAIAKLKESGNFWRTRFDGQHVSEGKAKNVYLAMAGSNTVDAITLCKFMAMCDTMLTGNEISNLLNAITGSDYNYDSLTEVGERLVQLKRAFNIRCGLTRSDDKLPERVQAPVEDEAGVHGTLDMDTMLKEFYETAQWDWETGKPLREKLLSLGLDKEAEDLWGTA
ncbi:MAG: aldehyde ferredoxin oxidoreductase family protein [Desulfobacula sp.]|uniref:aldehyde ferredoxin oxidoreductase family protein n=1 Tax=Desulfobacula sp. TaxID=2593537 RepID=UPI0025BAB563|nr:aldehyde ferredoxin oxidoreductase family protein [Desulfobacula sp.]MCD4719150.1 aldehyde ferredoxin oxidoreductase family protein [Desulfobacula sp.]